MESRELAFFGKVTAGVTHEMKNVLAIIQETAGLLEDLLLMSREESFPHSERFSRALSTIKSQVGRGVGQADRLNHFAHTPDNSPACVDLTTALEDTVFLAQRFARLKQVKLSLKPAPEASCKLNTSPFRLYMALFGIMEWWWNGMAPGSELSVEARGCEGGAAVTVSLETGQEMPVGFIDGLPGSDEWRRFSDSLAEINGRMEICSSARGVRVVLSSVE